MTALAPGSTIGRYRIRSRLGAGGMGVVYLALDEGLERQVALKVVAPELARDPDFQRRFTAEARAAAAVEHPHLLPIFEAGEHDGRLYLAMRYVPGFDLGTIIDRQALSLERTVDLVAQIADALDAAHAAGLVHRDVKPSNVLVGPGDHAYLADFGLAIAAAQSSRLTRTGEMAVGSADYIAPELVAGQPPDVRSDVYSLACLAYACLTGAPPFERGDEMARLYAHVHDAPPAASSRRPDLPSRMDEVLIRGLAKDPAERPKSAGEFASALAKAAGVSLGAVEVADEGPADIELPYVGLRPFDEKDAEYFFGREIEIDALVEKLREERFLAVFGPSGSGKSSLVRAGLVPALRRGAIEGSERWPVRVLRPGAHPLEALAQQLVGLRQDASIVRTLDDLAGDPRTLALEIALALPDDDPQARFVWIIDQAEELFTLADEHEQRAAIANLVHAGTVPDGRAIVVLAMRADFYHRCALHPELAAAVSGSQYLVSPMEADALVRAIVEPAALVGLKFEPGLVETLLDDIAGRTGGLPLLEHALTELWERRRGATLTLAAYREAGGVEGAIATRAETVYGGLEPAQQERVRQLLLRLTVPGEGTEDTKRRAPLRELVVQANDRGELEQVVDDLVRARLVTVATDESGEPMVDMAHEALLRAWPRMQEWIAESRDALRSRRRIADAAAEWQRLGQDEDALLRGSRLVEAREFAAAEPQLLNEDERAFVARSETRDEEERVGRERSRRRLTVAAIALAGVFMLLALITGIQWLGAEQNARRADENAARAEENAQTAEANAARAADNESTAREQAVVARTRQLAAQSVSSHDRLDLALLLAAEAGTRPDVLEARASLLDAIGEEPRLLRFLPGDSGAVRQLSFIGNGQLLSAGRGLSLWDVETGRKLTDLQSAIDTRAWAEMGASDLARPVFAVRADGDRVAWGSYWEEGSEASWLSIYDVQSGATTGCGAPCAAPPLAPERAWAITAISYSEDGDSLLVAQGGTLHLFDAERGTFRATVVAPQPDFGFPSALSADGRWFAVANDEVVHVWRIENGAAAGPIVLPPPSDIGTDSFPAPLQALTFSDDGTRLAGLRGPGGLGMVDVWQVEDASLIPFSGGTVVGWTSDREPRRPLVDARRLAFGDQGATLWTATSAGAVEPWDLSAAGSSIAPALGGYTQQPTSLAVASNGVPASGSRQASVVAAGYSDGRIVIWRTSDGPFETPGHLAAPLVSDPEFENGPFWLSTDGTAYATARSGGAPDSYSIDVLDLTTGEIRHTVTLEAPPRPDLTFPILAVRLSSLDGTLAALVLGEGDDATLSAWSLDTGALIATRETPFVGPWLPFAVSSDGQTVALLGGGFGASETTTLWDVRSGRDVVIEREWTADDAAVTGIAFGAGDESIISWSGNTTAGEFDLPAAVRVRAVGDDEEAELVFQIDSSSVCAVAESRDGSMFAIAYQPRAQTVLGIEGELHLFDGQSRSVVGPLGGGCPTGLAFDAAGSLISVSQHPANEIMRWDVDPVSWRSVACDLASRNFTRDEWNIYFSGEPYRPTCPDFPPT